eukprot:747870-Hanusia_phi.AAC.5
MRVGWAVGRYNRSDFQRLRGVGGGPELPDRLGWVMSFLGWHPTKGLKGWCKEGVVDGRWVVVRETWPTKWGSEAGKMAAKEAENEEKRG